MKPGAFATLKERGFVSQCSDEQALARLLDSEPVTFYIGFDPTAPSLHVGHMVQLFAMAHLQRAGHRPIALIGDGTSRIGDPSGKTEMRKILPIETLNANAERFRKQISRFLDFSGGKGLMLNNADWLAELNYIDFLRDIGRHFSVNRMLSFETYKMRLDTGLSFIEFNYQILQAYDYLVLHQRQGCRLQMGGDDQWGNIVAGMDLVRRVEGAECFALTTPLVTRADGQKMGKTEKGALFLDPEQVSPYQFYQYWLNVPDADVAKLLALFTFLPIEEVRELGRLEGRETNRAKERLALELTAIVHGTGEAQNARSASRALFGAEGGADKDSVDSATLERGELEQGVNIVDLLVRAGLCSSKGEARRLVSQGGAYLDGENVDSIEFLLDRGYADRKEILLRAGKKRYFRFLIE
ncbi:MAG: tyrosine--tRNA ligase [Spirochaetales bacterium]|nr:tyrosine--tRNA ligase [Spirochaetales bacterium]